MVPSRSRRRSRRGPVVVPSWCRRGAVVNTHGNAKPLSSTFPRFNPPLLHHLSLLLLRVPVLVLLISSPVGRGPWYLSTPYKIRLVQLPGKLKVSLFYAFPAPTPLCQCWFAALIFFVATSFVVRSSFLSASHLPT